MKVLVIEDDEFKQRRIAQAVREFWPAVEVLLERSVNSGLNGIVQQHPDLVLLDMSLTTFDVGPNEPGGRPQNFGGIEVLRQMERRNLVIPVIVITQHERFATGTKEVHLQTLHEELAKDHAQVFRGLVYYNSAAGGWERHLRLRMKEALHTPGVTGDKRTRSRRRPL